MSGGQEPKQTPIHAAHARAGARMAPFAGFELPVSYTGIVDEHLAVREKAGLFDVSHMGEFSVRGPQALDLLQKVTCNNVARLKTGRAHYTGLMLPNGAFVDDLLIYRFGEDDFLMVPNAANVDKDLAYMREHAAPFDVEVEDVSSRYGQIALQGPAARKILASVCDAALEEMKYYSFVHADVAGSRCLVSRTGYTGEDGFELYAPADRAEGIWYELLTAGAPDGLVPVGLGARDTLRLEAKMALYGNDIDETTSALEADLGWIVKFKKGDFIGREALEEQKEQGIRRKLVGFEMEGRAIARHGYDAWFDGEPVGKVTSGSRAPYLQKNIGLAYLPPEIWEPGSCFEVEIRGRREGAVVVPTPFYVRNR